MISNSLIKLNFNSIREYLIWFYIKRIKRIIPALFICVLVVTFVSISFVDAFDKNIIRTGVASLLGLSNLYQIRIGNDYFGLNSKANVFTHTWSLGIEEQFYFLFPVILFVLIKYNKNIIYYLALFLGFSLVVFFVLFHFNKIVQYFFPLSRFWEILAGAIAFFLSNKHRSPKISYLEKVRTYLYFL